MIIQRIQNVEASIPEFVDYIVSGGVGRYNLGEIVLPHYAIGDAVRIEYVDAQGDIGVVVEVLPHESDEHGETRSYLVRYVASTGAMCEMRLYESQIVEVLIAARQNAMAVACRGDEDLDDPIRPLGYLRDLIKESRRDDVYDLICGTEDPLAGIEAYVEAERLVQRLCDLTGTTFPGTCR